MSMPLDLTLVLLHRIDHDLHRETERDWDKELAEDVKGECEDKYGKVEAIKIEKETQVGTFLVHKRFADSLVGRDLCQV
jgi:hypothetical protein